MMTYLQITKNNAKYVRKRTNKLMMLPTKLQDRKRHCGPFSPMKTMAHTLSCYVIMFLTCFSTSFHLLINFPNPIILTPPLKNESDPLFSPVSPSMLFYYLLINLITNIFWVYTRITSNLHTDQ